VHSADEVPVSIAVASIVLGMAGLAIAVLLAMRAGSGAAQRERDAGLAASWAGRSSPRSW
jgi:multisubunit Na+/H+ antiporter MnhC subunit